MKLLQRPSRQLSIIICLCILACAFSKNLYMLCFSGARLRREVGRADIIPTYQMRKQEGAGSFFVNHFVPEGHPIVTVAVCTNFKYCNYPKPRCFLVSFFWYTGRRAGWDFKGKHSVLSPTNLPASLDPGGRERNTWLTLGWRLTLRVVWRWGDGGCGQSETARRWHARCHPETLSQELSLFGRPGVSPSPSSWLKVFLSERELKGRERGPCRQPREQVRLLSASPGASPALSRCSESTEAQRVSSALGRGVWKPDPPHCAVAQASPAPVPPSPCCGPNRLLLGLSERISARGPLWHLAWL